MAVRSSDLLPFAAAAPPPSCSSIASDLRSAFPTRLPSLSNVGRLFIPIYFPSLRLSKAPPSRAEGLYQWWQAKHIKFGSSSGADELDFSFLQSPCLTNPTAGARTLISNAKQSCSLFVKNLNFKTNEESLRKHVTENIKDGKVTSVRIKKHLKNGKNVSMGFGFVEFDSVEAAANASKDLQGTVLDGHALILQLSRPKTKEKLVKKATDDLSSTKLIVRNVAFEATEKQLRELFGLYGQVKSLRLPKKLGNHRGFAFVEYSTKQETQKALQSLSSTHLYGRHLVLERAKEGESLEELRVRTAAHYSDEKSGFQASGKASKKRKLMAASDRDDF